MELELGKFEENKLMMGFGWFFEQDQLGDVLHWIRQVVALVCGLLWGAVPVVGGIWIFM